MTLNEALKKQVERIIQKLGLTDWLVTTYDKLEPFLLQREKLFFADEFHTLVSQIGILNDDGTDLHPAWYLGKVYPTIFSTAHTSNEYSEWLFSFYLDKLAHLQFGNLTRLVLKPQKYQPLVTIVNPKDMEQKLHDTIHSNKENFKILVFDAKIPEGEKYGFKGAKDLVMNCESPEDMLKV